MKNLKTKTKNKNLDHIKVGTFFIKVKKEIVSYKLELLKNTQVYLKFYILLLELADLKTPL